MVKSMVKNSTLTATPWPNVRVSHPQCHAGSRVPGLVGIKANQTGSAWPQGSEYPTKPIGRGLQHGSHVSFTTCTQLDATLFLESREGRGVNAKEHIKVRSFPWGIGALLVVLIAGGIGFWLGAGSSVATVAAPAASAPVVYGFHWFGFPFFGFFFFLLFLFVIFAVIRRVAWGRRGGPGWYGHGYGAGYSQNSGWKGGPGPGGWNGRDIPPMADDMLQRWHRRAHGEPELETPTPPPSNPGQTTPPGPTSPSA